MRYTWTCLVFGLISAPSSAETWYVDKGGLGDFTVIQDAIDAAADGDTVRVGPGRYDDFRPYETLFDGTPIQSIVMIRKEVVLEGSGAESTFIGPDTYVPEVSGRVSVGFFLDVGGAALLRNVTLERSRSLAIVVGMGTLEGCSIDGSDRDGAKNGILAIGAADDVQVIGCEFIGNGGLVSLFPDGVERLFVTECTFTGAGDASVGIVVRGESIGTRIVGSRFQGLAQGIQFTAGGVGTVEDCVFLPQSNGVGINVDSGICRVESSFIGTTSQPIRCTGGRIEVMNSVIEGGVVSGSQGTTVLVTGTALISNSHVLNGNGLTLDGPNIPNRPVDVRNNWWGTTDLALIESWIKDDNGEVLYLPILEAPVSATAESIGSFKSRFVVPRNR